MLAQGVRTKTVKRAARVIIEKYYPRMTLDFQTNKRVCEEVAMIPTKALKNKIAGYATVSTRPANLHSPRAGGFAAAALPRASHRPPAAVWASAARRTTRTLEY